MPRTRRILDRLRRIDLSEAATTRKHFRIMSAPAQLNQLGPGEGPAFSAVGDVYRFLATGEQTGGAYVLSEARVLPGGGPPPHVHRREDEAFFVLEGEITFTLGNRKVVAQPGSFI